jgi:hypothetical protein
MIMLGGKRKSTDECDRGKDPKVLQGRLRAAIWGLHHSQPLSMAAMSDLRFKTKGLDAELGSDCDFKRIVGAVRALVSELSVVGKAPRNSSFRGQNANDWHGSGIQGCSGSVQTAGYTGCFGGCGGSYGSADSLSEEIVVASPEY